MKCPLRVKYKRFLWWKRIIGNEDCLKEECAWWDEEKNCCSGKVLAKEITRLQLQKRV